MSKESSGHWYNMKGEPVYTVMGSNKKIRETTLRDAKKLNLWPGVTTILKAKADSYFLAEYKKDQLLDAVIECPYNFLNEDEVEWRKKVKTMSYAHVKRANVRGGIIHNALEDYMVHGKPFKESNTEELDVEEICQPVIEFLNDKFQGVQWISEASFTSPFGYGGKVDLHSKEDKIVLDFKTKDTDDVSKMVAYDDHHMQTAAYAEGLFGDSFTANVKRYNLFISTKESGLLNLTESTDFPRDWMMFYHLLKYWQLDNNHSPY